MKPGTLPQNLDPAYQVEHPYQPLNIPSSSSSCKLFQFLTAPTETRAKTQRCILIPVVDHSKLTHKSIMHQKSYSFWGNMGLAPWAVIPPAILSCAPEEVERLHSMVQLKSPVGKSYIGITKHDTNHIFFCFAYFKYLLMIPQEYK